MPEIKWRARTKETAEKYNKMFGEYPEWYEKPKTELELLKQRADSLGYVSKIGKLLKGEEYKPEKLTDYEKLRERELAGTLTKADSIKAGFLPRAKEKLTEEEKEAKTLGIKVDIEVAKKKLLTKKQILSDEETDIIKNIDIIDKILTETEEYEEPAETKYKWGVDWLAKDKEAELVEKHRYSEEVRQEYQEKKRILMDRLIQIGIEKEKKGASWWNEVG